MGTLDRNGVASVAGMLLANRAGHHVPGHEWGAYDAAHGRVYSEHRTTFQGRDEYDLGYRVGRFILFAKLPDWRKTMLTNKDADDLWLLFLMSPEARAGDEHPMHSKWREEA